MSITALLREIDPRFKDTINFLGIVSANHAKQFNFPIIEISAETLVQTVKKHDFDQAKALSRAFDASNWRNWRTFDFYPSPLAPAEARLKQVEQFLETNS